MLELSLLRRFKALSVTLPLRASPLSGAQVLLGKPLFAGRNVVNQLEIITDLLGTPSADVIAKVCAELCSGWLLPPGHEMAPLDICLTAIHSENLVDLQPYKMLCSMELQRALFWTRAQGLSCGSHATRCCLPL